MNKESHPSGSGHESQGHLRKINEDYERLQQEERAPRLPDSLMNDFWKGLSDKLAHE